MSKCQTAYAPEFRQQLVELVHAQMERDILAKATASFAGKSEKTLERLQAHESKPGRTDPCVPCMKRCGYLPAIYQRMLRLAGLPHQQTRTS